MALNRRQSWDTSSYDNGSLKHEGTKWVSAVLEKHLPLPGPSLSGAQADDHETGAGPANC